MPSVAYRRPTGRSAAAPGAVMNSGPLRCRSLPDREPDPRPHRRLDRGPAHLAVALGRVAVADREPGAVVEDRQEQRRARGQVAGVHVAAVDVGRDRRERPRPRRDAQLAAERDDRDADAGEELGPLPDRRQAGDLVGRIRELVGEQPEARDRRGPAPVGRLEVEQLDLERVAGLRTVDRDGPVDLVDAREVERRRSPRRPSSGSACRCSRRAGRTRPRRRRRRSRSAGSRDPRRGGTGRGRHGSEGSRSSLVVVSQAGGRLHARGRSMRPIRAYFTVNVPSARTPVSSSTRMRYSAGERPVSASCS